MDFSTFTYESGVEEALDFLRKCLPSVPPTVDATNIMDYLRSGIVLCKFVPPPPIFLFFLFLFPPSHLPLPKTHPERVT